MNYGIQTLPEQLLIQSGETDSSGNNSVYGQFVDHFMRSDSLNNTTERHWWPAQLSCKRWTYNYHGLRSGGISIHFCGNPLKSIISIDWRLLIDYDNRINLIIICISDFTKQYGNLRTFTREHGFGVNSKRNDDQAKRLRDLLENANLRN